ncbi:MAG: vitamin B12-dependent ribonucleotide reductase [Deltaproteobacteria bacterium]|nr:vitamin B12-dependent ribonucleotide reductase [Deltaproteobacteria bacterium]
MITRLEGRRSKKTTSKKATQDPAVAKRARLVADGAKSPARAEQAGLVLERYFTRPGRDPFSEVEWELRTAAITGEGGKIYFEQADVEIPKAWSQTATNVVVQKYFRGMVGSPQRERSVKQLIGRVADTIASWAAKGSYFASECDSLVFRDELVHLLVHQKMSFNSPVWFNVGVEEHPQCSACFINSVEDSMDSILTLARTEGMLFKWGSGTGSNLSSLRSSKEHLNGGGTASGPVSFMRGYDSFAGAIKSGGKTRRAAKMVILNADHPDIVDFVECKAREERKAWALIDAGFDGGFNVPGGAYDSIAYQNANHSVRVTDEFMEAVLRDGEWRTRAVTDGRTVEAFKARDLLRKIAEAAHQCGDPGMQFDTTVNAYHTCPNTSRINASNPCSEYMFVDDSACNLASLNLRKFQREDGELDVESFRRAVEITVIAQEVIVDNAKYPTERIEKNSHRFRPLGLGYANLGALLMSRGFPYDSEPGRAYSAAITALMCGQAYVVSARIARDAKGPFAGYAVNREPFLGVMEKHRRHVDQVDAAYVPYDLVEAARAAWDEAVAVGREHGFRNAQTTVLAPTGTIGFMMDCDTTGIEPDIALVKYKRLVGGGMLKIVNQTVPEALERLGYTKDEIQSIRAHIDEKETIEGAPSLKPEHLPVFDCAFRSASGTRSIHYMGHVRMMAATQPFLSGAISKTVNLPNDCPVEDIEKAYLEAWRLGLKAIAVYRDGCKRTQPLMTGKGQSKPDLASQFVDTATALAIAEAERLRSSGPPSAVRRKLPDERRSLTHKFSIGGHEGYITCGLYEDGSPGEIFVRMAKEGSTIAGLMDSFATAISLALQHGVPLRLLCDKFRGTRFEPSGFTGNPEIPRATSIMDYIFRWLDVKFLAPKEAEEAEAKKLDGTQLDLPQVPVLPAAKPIVIQAQDPKGWVSETDAPTCHECGTIMVRSGACHKCTNCGSTSGCS